MSDLAEVPTESALFVERDILISAPAAVVWDALLEDLDGFSDHNGKSMNFKLEAWPGGRWFRDLAPNVGHFWGHVQVIKPATLLEISGPMMMSFPAINHVAWRLTDENGSTRLRITHRAMGEIKSDMARGFGDGWQASLDRVQRIVAARR